LNGEEEKEESGSGYHCQWTRKNKIIRKRPRKINPWNPYKNQNKLEVKRRRWRWNRRETARDEKEMENEIFENPIHFISFVSRICYQEMWLLRKRNQSIKSLSSARLIIIFIY
jgi:hypothetical protein